MGVNVVMPSRTSDDYWQQKVVVSGTNVVVMIGCVLVTLVFVARSSTRKASCTRVVVVSRLVTVLVIAVGTV